MEARHVGSALAGWSILDYSCSRFFVGVVAGVTKLDAHLTSSNMLIIYTTVGALGSMAFLSWAAIRGGAAAGHGDVRAGLGDGAIARPILLALIVILISTYGAVVTLGIFSASPNLIRQMTNANLVIVATSALITVLGAPVAEELFFRGWLWTGLRTRWGGFISAMVTSLMWLLAHIPEGIARMTLLLPLAIMLPFSRHLCRSVRAPVIVHICNNAAVTLSPWIALWLGWLART